MPGGSVAAPTAASALGVAPGVARPSTPAVGVVVDAGVAGRDVGAAEELASACADDAGVPAAVGVRVGGGVTAGQVPDGDGGGGSVPVCKSYLKPMSSPPLTVTFETPRSEVAHAPPPRETNSTQYEPDVEKQPGG